MKDLEIRFDIDKKDFDRKMKLMTDAVDEFKKKMQSASQIEVSITIVEPAKKKWFQFWK